MPPPALPAMPCVARLLMFGAYRRHIHSYLETISRLQEQLPATVQRLVYSIWGGFRWSRKRLPWR
jgi:phosphoenolpyruvate carboxylase